MNFNKFKNVAKQFDVAFQSYQYKKNLKALHHTKTKSLGRSHGKIVAWHRGGGVRRNYRALTTKIDSLSNYGVVRNIEYDPNRSSFIALIQHQSGSFSYVLANHNTKINDVYLFSVDQNIARTNGDLMKLLYAPVGVPLYNLESYPNAGFTRYSKAAGTSCTLISKYISYGKIKLPSGEERLFDLNCLVSLGSSSNSFSRFNRKYKAGTNRLLNKRPTVRGTAMNPIDHPHGGGAGKTAPGRPSVSPWGKLTKGFPTRNKKLYNKFIVKRK